MTKDEHPTPDTSQIMTESSTIQSLQAFRERLIVLKQDRTTYIKSSDVLRFYEELCGLLRAHELKFGVAEDGDANAKTKNADQLECKAPRTMRYPFRSPHGYVWIHVDGL